MELTKGAALSLPKGYMQTEIGIIPNDWKINQLSEITILMTNGFVGTATSFYSESDSDILYIQGYNVEENGFNFRGIKFVTKDFHKQHSKSSLQEGDLLTIQTGDVGLTTIVPKELVGSNCHALIISRFKKENFNSKYYSYYFNSYVGRSRLKSIETGTTMKHINVGDLLQFVVPIPPTKAEQTAIATALSDADAYISALEKLIEKKRNIKQGAMQQLLSSKGSDGKPKKGWVVKRLGEICEIEKGEQLNRATLSENDSYPVFNGGINPSGYTNVFNQNKNTIIISEGGNSCGFINYVKTKFWQGGHCYSLKTKLNNDFIFQALKFSEKSIMALRVGSGLPNIQRSRLIAFEIFIPKTEKEQIEIATILSDIDNEISSLEKKLSKSKMLKQGMMQELLTGKIRLV